MDLDRRTLLGGLGIASILSDRAGAVETRAMPDTDGNATLAVALPDRASFVFDGIDLNAAYTHAVGLPAMAATDRYNRSRLRDAARNWPVDNPRDAAVELYARLIGAQPADVAVVPSTLVGENLIAASLGLGPGAGVVTDPFHYDASLAMYGERAKGGMPLTVLTPRANRIDHGELERAILPETRLVAVSLVSSDTGYLHDLKRVCAIAHARGALVYADVIQAVGAIPFDVGDSGVDFACAGHYKWLMGEFGAAFLYVRPDRLPLLRRTQVGWAGIAELHKHFMPFDTPGPIGGDWTLGTDARSVFEVGTPSWGALATATGSLAYLHDLGIKRIAAYRRPMLERLQDAMPRLGFVPLTPRDAQGPSVVFALKGARDRLRAPLERARIYTTLAANRIRIAPSVHNDMTQIDAFIDTVRLALKA